MPRLGPSPRAAAAPAAHRPHSSLTPGPMLQPYDFGVAPAVRNLCSHVFMSRLPAHIPEFKAKPAVGRAVRGEIPYLSTGRPIKHHSSLAMSHNKMHTYARGVCPILPYATTVAYDPSPTRTPHGSGTVLHTAALPCPTPSCWSRPELAGSWCLQLP